MTQDLHYLTIHQLKELISKGDVSSVEITKAVLSRIESVESNVKSFVSIHPDSAIKQASIADNLVSQGNINALTGIPAQLKDNLCTLGVNTTCSSRMLENFVPPYNATVVNKLYEVGSVFLGKGNMDEFAMGSSTENSAFFPTHNPWDLDRVPGGSSGGPAAAVAAGEAIYALGSDTGGSIRQPASLCGIVGLKPTYGLVSRFGLIAFASSLDQIGPMTRDVTDCAIVLNTIAGQDRMDSTSIKSENHDYTDALTTGIKGLRIGIPKEYYSKDIDTEISQALKTAIDKFADMGAIVEEISLPHTEYALSVYYILAPSEASSNLARYDGVKYGLSALDADSMWQAMENTKQQGFGPEVKRRIMLGTYALSSGYYDAYYLKAQKVRTIIREEFRDAFHRYDAIITPTSPSTAFKIGEKTSDPTHMYLSDICTIPANIAGIPAISIPCGFVEGLPVGMQIMAKPLAEDILLKLAYNYEQATRWQDVRPQL
ncbi:MAG: Asp-tRNA(Asn)/Glu-tRNA(Gln) amidotransferase subunit GatA [SAR202 cluster bacterium]|nr:Asp-tRNA(Asn)/Glu-tRNA(Gln) amidotransferase subunit GatA [SAR202 cluster bacterium]|tara:strand:+ start:9968 stop:11428 length:1461 start_codon:yes stop_codon:yes gene_type:complete